MGPRGQSRGPPMEITWALRGNHDGPQRKSRGPPGAITWAPRGNHVGPHGQSRVTAERSWFPRVPWQVDVGNRAVFLPCFCCWSLHLSSLILRSVIGPHFGQIWSCFYKNNLGTLHLKNFSMLEIFPRYHPLLFIPVWGKSTEKLLRLS